MIEESKESTSTEPSATTPADAPPPATTAPPQATGSTAATTTATTTATTAAESTPAATAASATPPAADPVESYDGNNPPASTTTAPTPADAPAPAAEPTPVAEPAAATLRIARFEFLQAAVQHGVQGHAVASTSPADKRVAALAEHADTAKRELKALGISDDWVMATLQLLDKLRNVQLPTQDEITGWINLAQEVFSLWRQFFSHAKPVDQELADALHNLGNSIDAHKIVGKLAQRAEATGKAGHMDVNTFEQILDGHQEKELLAIGVKPLTILPLVNAVSHAKAMLAAKAEHEKVSAAARD